MTQSLPGSTPPVHLPKTEAPAPASNDDLTLQQTEDKFNKACENLNDVLSSSWIGRLVGRLMDSQKHPFLEKVHALLFKVSSRCRHVTEMAGMLGNQIVSLGEEKQRLRDKIQGVANKHLGAEIPESSSTAVVLYRPLSLPHYQLKLADLPPLDPFFNELTHSELNPSGATLFFKPNWRPLASLFGGSMQAYTDLPKLLPPPDMPQEKIQEFFEHLTPKDMQEPIMKFTDTFNRYCFAIRATLADSNGKITGPAVQVFYQTEHNDPINWDHYGEDIIPFNEAVITDGKVDEQNKESFKALAKLLQEKEVVIKGYTIRLDPPPTKSEK